MREKLEKISSFLCQGLVERDVPARLSLLAALSGEHILFIGPPGTAKSELSRKLHHVFNQAQYFERLLTRFSVPEELFGPLSIKALEQDRYQRLTTNYLPEASIAFIDEVFKANSAILNALLTLLNEREFDNGSERIKTPLICVLAASNELPDDDSLQALYDRFLLRYHVAQVSDDNFDALLEIAAEQQTVLEIDECLTVAEIEQLQIKSESILLTDEARQLLKTLRLYLHEQDIYISDRRWVKLIKLLKVAAYTNQQSSINQYDCALLIHSVWIEPQQIVMITRWFEQYLDLDFSAALQRFEKLVKTWEHKSEDDKKKYIHKTNDRGEKLFITPDGEITILHEKVTLAVRDNEVLYLSPPDQKDRTNEGRGYTLSELEIQFFDDRLKQTHINGKWVDVQNYVNNTQNRLVDKIQHQPVTEPCYFSLAYVEAARADVKHVIDELAQLRHHYTEQQALMSSMLDSHLWLAGSFIEQYVSASHDQLQQLFDFEHRMHNVEISIDNLLIENNQSSTSY